MKKVFLIFFLTVFQLNARCDTITNWQVYHNGQLLAKFNAFTEDLDISLKRKDIQIGDSITIYFFTDVTCFECRSFLRVVDDNQIEITRWSGFGTFQPKKINLAPILQSKRNHFQILLYDIEIDLQAEQQVLVSLHLE